MRATLDQPVAMNTLDRLAAGQHGVVTAAQAQACGFTDREIAALARNGWQRLCRGAYLLPGYDVSAFSATLAHQLLQPHLVASHAAAASIWGIEGVRFVRELTSET